MPIWARIILILLGLTIGLGSGVYYVWGTQRAAAARHWSQAPGRIVSASLEREESTDTDDRGRSRTSVTWSPRITYSYQVGGRILRNDVIWLTAARAFSNGEEGDAFIASYPPGSPVIVRYDPANPGDSCLFANPPPLIVLLFCPIGFLFAGLTFLFPGERAFTRRWRRT